MTDWKKEIAVAYLVKQELMKVDVRQLWPYHLPEVAATQDQVQAAEVALGHELDAKYKAFLRHANGWKGFFHAVDLFGTDDLIGSTRKAMAEEILDGLAGLVEGCGLSREQVFPIAVSQVGIDVFVMVRPCSPSCGAVIWLAGQEIDRFPDFTDYFLAMVDYNRREMGENGNCVRTQHR